MEEEGGGGVGALAIVSRKSRRALKFKYYGNNGEQRKIIVFVHYSL
jgi:hypothetical protein